MSLPNLSIIGAVSASDTVVKIDDTPLKSIQRIEIAIDAGKLTQARLYVVPSALNLNISSYRVVSLVAEELARQIADAIGAEQFIEKIYQTILDFAPQEASNAN